MPKVPVFHVGEATVEPVVELATVPVDLHWLLPTANATILDEERRWLDARFIHPTEPRVNLTTQSWLIRSRGRTILVDCCIGNGRERPVDWMNNVQTPWLERLEAAGVTPEQVDYVLCTHLHADHVGWNTRLLDGRWVPTFPKAKYIAAEREYAAAVAAYREGSPRHGFVADAILPVAETGQVVTVADGTVLEEELGLGIRLVATPGHTVGHMAVYLDQGSERAVMSGDAIHHPIQLAHPDLPMRADADAALASVTRRKLLEEMVETGAMLVPAHFATPGCGQVERRGNAFGYRWCTPA